MQTAAKTVLIVGAGAGQVPAIQTARAMGWRVVTVDRSPDAHGMTLADVAHPVDILDLEGVLAVATAENVDGALTMQSDIGVPTIGFVNERLGLPGVTMDVAQRCSRKDLARLAWAASGVPQPAFEVTDAANAAEAVARVGYPCVVKATDSSGSRGVVKVERGSDVAAAITEAARYSRNGTLLVERYVEGLEMGAQTFSLDGRCRLVLLHNDQVSAPPYMVPTGHSYPLSESVPSHDEIRAAIARAVDALGIRDGPANVDLILDPSGRPMLLEVGARIGATCLPELTTLHTGIDWVKASLLSAVGITPSLDVTDHVACAASIIEAPADGVLDSFEVADWVTEHADVLEVEFSALPGATVSKLRKGTDRIGHVLARGVDLGTAEGLVRRVLHAITVRVS